MRGGKRRNLISHVQATHTEKRNKKTRIYKPKKYMQAKEKISQEGKNILLRKTWVILPH